VQGRDLGPTLFAPRSGVTRSKAGPPPAPSPSRGACDEALETFDRAWSIIHETHFDPDFNGVDWSALRDELRPHAAEATTHAELRGVLGEMISRLGQSHFAVFPGAIVDGTPAGGGEGGAGLPGFDVRLIEERFIVNAVTADSAAERSGVRPGWVLAAVGDRRFDDWSESFGEIDDGPAGRYVAYETVLGRLAGRPGSRAAVTFLDGADAEVRLDVEREEPEGERAQIGNLPPFFARLQREEIGREAPGPRVGYILFNVWMPVVGRAFDEAVDAFRDADGVIVDLRGNPGGVGGMVMGFAGHFLDERVALKLMPRSKMKSSSKGTKRTKKKRRRHDDPRQRGIRREPGQRRQQQAGD